MDTIFIYLQTLKVNGPSLTVRQLTDFMSLWWLSSARKKLSQLISHMTPYKLDRVLSLVENLFVKKNPLQDLLSSLNAVISTNERS